MFGKVVYQETKQDSWNSSDNPLPPGTYNKDVFTFLFLCHNSVTNRRVDFAFSANFIFLGKEF